MGYLVEYLSRGSFQSRALSETTPGLGQESGSISSMLYTSQRNPQQGFMKMLKLRVCVCACGEIPHVPA